MSSKEYSEKLNELQSKILFTNISNLGKDVKKAEKTFFKEAKQKRKSLETACKQRNSRKIQEIVFEPKAANIKVNFDSDKSKINNFLNSKKKENKPPSRKSEKFDEFSLNDEIVSASESVNERVHKKMI